MSPISTHTPLTGRDDFDYWYRTGFPDFYSHAPYGTWLNPVFENATGRNFYSHAPYGTWLETYPVPLIGDVISTHTPLTGRDFYYGSYSLGIPDFYSHAPYGTWLSDLRITPHEQNFYSHAPYGTWPLQLNALNGQINFYSHAPYGTWHTLHIYFCSYRHFYSHAPYGTWPLHFVFM